MTEKGRLVFDGAHVRAVHFGETDRISVMLDHGRPKRNGFPVQAPQRTMANMGIGTLSIMLSEASWFLTPENQALRAALDAHCSKARDVRAIGFSMGGFGAALLSKSLHLRKALLISPQYSIFPSRAPWDRRRNWISRNFKEEWDDLDQQMNCDLTGAILFDPRILSDIRHMRLLRGLAPQLAPVAVPFGGHPAISDLMDGDEFWKICVKLFDDDNLALWLQRFRREKREKSRVYLKGMTTYLDRREIRKGGMMPPLP